jgi:hypothetical protein
MNQTWKEPTARTQRFQTSWCLCQWSNRCDVANTVPLARSEIAEGDVRIGELRVWDGERTQTQQKKLFRAKNIGKKDERLTLEHNTNNYSINQREKSRCVSQDCALIPLYSRFVGIVSVWRTLKMKVF